MATKAAAAKTTAKASTPATNGQPSVRLTQLFIDNEWSDPVDGGSFETYNPATGQAIATVAAAGPADVDRAVKAARRRSSRVRGARWTPPTAAG